MPPTSIDGNEITGATIDGQEVSEITVDGDVVFTAGPDIPDSGVSRWEFQQDVTDSWGPNDGTLTGGTFTTTVQIGTYALDFDGVDDHVTIPNDASFQWGTGGFAISYWIRADAAVAGERHIAFENGTDGFEVSINQNSNYQLVTRSGGDSTTLLASNLPTTGTWEHRVCQRFSDNTTEIWVDNSLIASGTSSDNISFSHDGAIGSYYDGSSNFFDGTLDDVRFYDRGLSSTDINNLYNTGSISG